MLRAIFFDMGGTLDGNGRHWLDRFVDEYAKAGASLPRPVIRAAFDEAERRSATDDAIMSAGLEEMVDRHLGWQIEHLIALGALSAADGIGGKAFRAEVVQSFTSSVRADAWANVALLEELHARGLGLGVVSNACGNVDRLCDDFGFSPYLSLVVDSRRIGVAKPDPGIYQYALSRLGLPPAATMMVGDSFERDVVPARALGMQTAWLEGPEPRACPDRSVPELILASLSDFAGALDALSRTVA